MYGDQIAGDKADGGATRGEYEASAVGGVGEDLLEHLAHPGGLERNAGAERRLGVHGAGEGDDAVRVSDDDVARREPTRVS